MIKNSIEHLKNSRMSYWAHFSHSLYNSYRLVKILVTSTVHAFLPFVFKTHAARGVIDIYNDMKKHAHLRKMMNDGE